MTDVSTIRLTHDGCPLNIATQVFEEVTRKSNYIQLIDDDLEIWEDFPHDNIIGVFRGIVLGDQTLPNSIIEFELSKGSDLSYSHSETIGKPGWVMFNRQNTHDTPLACGENKLSTAWNSDKSTLRKTGQTDWIWPFRQVLTYCVATNTRYGYILTTDELVVLRVYNNKDGHTGRPYTVQYKSVPIDSSGDSTLTSSLGLKALGMMALNGGQRHIASNSDTLPLNA
ncbi:hypothetical protein VHEMI06946 [[Torrubiella] hemipterigena]|uniref:Uncharacterized protein n=1 Tax=[Torrubiella] hemipterigena TaxID=1531966 RepID=A0A0A1T8X3_9HYPO|nr:hypothetical protein VHEMI06946 [[Torrubiella] hemipterigena]